jgi:ATP-dependent DNA helicase RecG
MDSTELVTTISLLRRRLTDLRDVEVKAAARDFPKAVAETLSAFANGDGGCLILGLEESTGFKPAPGFNAVRIRNALADTCHDQIVPPIRTDIDILDFEDAQVVVAVVPAADKMQRPCYVKARGEFNGSFIRGGDGDRRLTEYEIFLLHADRGQPREDTEPVPQASIEDLDPSAVRRLVERLRLRQPAAFAGVSDEVVLRRVGVLIKHDERLVPSLSGLLAMGAYPQQFFPQLNITFVAIPATSKQTIPADGPRFLDSRSIDGPIPVMVEEALSVLIRNMSARAVVRGAGREDVYDVPLEALREAVVNALMHRDYSGYARGTQVQIEMYSDRLVIRNPGGLFGPVTEDDLGEDGVSSSRNAHLARLLQDVTLAGSNRVVCENRGTGIPTMLAVLRQAGMTVPEFENRVGRFTVTFPKHSLLDAEAIAWIGGLGQAGLTEAQCMALGLMRTGRPITNAQLRQLGLDSREATSALGDLVVRGLAARTGGRRYATYVLTADPGDGAQFQLSLEDPPVTARPAGARRDRTAEVLAIFAGGASLSLAEVITQTGLGKAMAARYVERLMADGRIEATAPAKSRNRRFRLAR